MSISKNKLGWEPVCTCVHAIGSVSPPSMSGAKSTESSERQYARIVSGFQDIARVPYSTFVGLNTDGRDAFIRHVGEDFNANAELMRIYGAAQAGTPAPESFLNMPEVEPTCNPRLTKEDVMSAGGGSIVSICPSEDCNAKALKHPAASSAGSGAATIYGVKVTISGRAKGSRCWMYQALQDSFARKCAGFPIFSFNEAKTECCFTAGFYDETHLFKLLNIVDSANCGTQFSMYGLQGSLICEEFKPDALETRISVALYVREDDSAPDESEISSLTTRLSALPDEKRDFFIKHQSIEDPSFPAGVEFAHLWSKASKVVEVGECPPEYNSSTRTPANFLAVSPDMHHVLDGIGTVKIPKIIIKVRGKEKQPRDFGGRFLTVVELEVTAIDPSYRDWLGTRLRSGCREGPHGTFIVDVRVEDVETFEKCVAKKNLETSVLCGIE